MTVIHVQAPGLLTTVQDLGREGFGSMGVSASGAADAISLRIGNRLVGNAESAAGLEMTLLGGSFLFPEGAVVALTGSDFGASLDGAPVEQWTSVNVRAGQALSLGPTRSGARCYLCVRGGISVKPFLGSASTHLLSGLGGFDGRALRKGDLLDVGVTNAESDTASFRKVALTAEALERLSPRKILRVTPGPQSDWFPESSQRVFYTSAYRVTEESNRMGLRLEGERIPARSGGEMLTEGVSLGAIQVPNGGEPIVLFVEQQTTGGYPKIANVISADLSNVGQLRPRDEIRFEKVGWEVARSLLKEMEDLLTSENLIHEMH
ncbi:MAG TPA: biotin-dependent carboxyltransferase family protein [Terriglobales bacterium]|nr:biotin-dependent carboxyltransferase family protein [Terriglobales bacterium]